MRSAYLRLTKKDDFIVNNNIKSLISDFAKEEKTLTENLLEKHEYSINMIKNQQEDLETFLKIVDHNIEKIEKKLSESPCQKKYFRKKLVNNKLPKAGKEFRFLNNKRKRIHLRKILNENDGGEKQDSLGLLHPPSAPSLKDYEENKTTEKLRRSNRLENKKIIKSSMKYIIRNNDNNTLNIKNNENQNNNLDKFHFANGPDINNSNNTNTDNIKSFQIVNSNDIDKFGFNKIKNIEQSGKRIKFSNNLLLNEQAAIEKKNLLETATTNNKASEKNFLSQFNHNRKSNLRFSNNELIEIKNNFDIIILNKAILNFNYNKNNHSEEEYFKSKYPNKLSKLLDYKLNNKNPNVSSSLSVNLDLDEQNMCLNVMKNTNRRSGFSRNLDNLIRGLDGAEFFDVLSPLEFILCSNPKVIFYN